MLPTPGEGKWAKYDRRKMLKKLGLSQIPGPYKGFRYDPVEVELIRKALKPLPKTVSLHDVLATMERMRGLKSA